MEENSVGFNIEYERKKKLLKSLIEQLSKLIEEKDFLLNVKKVNIETKYMCSIGKYEMERMNLNFEIRALKKEISLRQSALNRGEVVSEEYIEQVMKEELRVWHEKVNAFSKQIKDAEIFMKLPKLSDEESKRFKSLYRKLIKLLHPDIHKCDERDKLLWQRVCEAYKNGDLEELENLMYLVENKNMDDLLYKQDESIEDKVEKLKNLIFKCLDKIDKIKKVFPFTIEKEISNDQWVKDKIDEIQINNQLLKTYRDKLKVVLSEFK